MAECFFYLTSSKAWTGWVWANSVQNIAGNYSDVTVSAVMWKTDGYTTSSNNYTSGTITIGTEQAAMTQYQEFKGSEDDPVSIYSGTHRVYHNSDGSKTITIAVSYWGQSGTSLSGVELSGSANFDLGTIARTSSFGATDAAIGSVSTISINRQSTAITHRIKVKFGSLTGYVTDSGGFQTNVATLYNTQISWTIPASFYAQIPNATSGECELTLITLSGSTEVGDRQTAKIRITTVSSRCNPTVSLTVAHRDAPVTSLTGSNTKFISGYSAALCTVSVSARYSATIVEIWADGQYTDNGNGTYTIDPVQSSPITFYAKDSRGYVGSKSVVIDILPYVVLTNNAVGNRTNPTDGSAYLEFSGQYFNGNFGAAQNSLSIQYYIEYPDGTFGNVESVTPTINQDTYNARVDFTGFEYTKVYYAHVTVKDKLLTLTKKVPIKQGLPVFDWGAHDFNINGDLNVNGTITINGKVFSPYDVDDIYITLSATSPASKFGGQWTQIKGRFLLGADDSSYLLGKEGGAASHVLTVEQLPTHNHSMNAGGAAYNLKSDSVVSWGGETNFWPIPYSNTGTVDSYINPAGGGKAHNNMPPYLVVYIWKKVS